VAYKSFSSATSKYFNFAFAFNTTPYFNLGLNSIIIIKFSISAKYLIRNLTYIFKGAKSAGFLMGYLISESSFAVFLVNHEGTIDGSSSISVASSSFLPNASL
jgi:hypothetical protein